MGSLDRFNSLETLETNFKLLLGDRALNLQGLHTVLPTSIVTVRLHADNAIDAPQYQPFLTHLTNSKAYLPQVSSFTLVGTPHADIIVPSPGPLVSQLKGLGVNFQFEPHPDD